MASFWTLILPILESLLASLFKTPTPAPTPTPATGATPTCNSADHVMVTGRAQLVALIESAKHGAALEAVAKASGVKSFEIDKGGAVSDFLAALAAWMKAHPIL